MGLSRVWKVPKEAGSVPNDQSRMLESLGWIRDQGLVWACSWMPDRVPFRVPG